MIAFWMLWSTWLGVITAGVALVAERAAVSWRWPRRAVWAVACAVNAAVSIGGITVPWLWHSPGLGTMAVTDALRAARDTAGAAGDLTSALGTAVGTRTLRDAWMDRLAPYDYPLLALWIVASAVLLAVVVVGVVRLRRARRAWRGERVDGVDVLVSERTGPAIVGVRAPGIVVPEWVLGYDAPLRALVVGHEREHVRARDPLLLAVARVVAVLLPWNVALWWSLSRLRLAVEMDCDARVLRALPDKRRYSLLLVAVAQARARVAGAALAPVLGFMRRSELAKRVTVIGAASGGSRVRAASFAGGALLAGFVIACDTPAPVVPPSLTISGLAFRSGKMPTRAEILDWLRANGELNVDTNTIEVFDEAAMRRMYGVTRMPELVTDDKLIVAAIARELAAEAPAQRLSGRVHLDIDVDETGRVTRLEAVDPPPLPPDVGAIVALTMDVPSRVLAIDDGDHDSVAPLAVKQAVVRAFSSVARFSPGALDGKPKAVRNLTLTYDFD
ncbi:MAG TPA: M56 family metallopeptidase [Gemmatimonadaceae bacterium]|nr:M56 family metallopeptidase [Gemmatimonadaceae bacterium]